MFWLLTYVFKKRILWVGVALLLETYMFISEEEALRRLNDSRNLFSPSYKKEQEVENPATEESHQKDKLDEIIDIVTDTDPYKVRARERSLRGEEKVQIAIGTTAEIIGNRAAGSLYGLSTEQSKAYNYGQSTLSDLGHGRDADRNRVPSRKAAVNRMKDSLAEIAADKLETALHHLTEDKIKDCSAIKVSSIARDMATVMDRVTRDNKNPEHIHFHIFKPEMKQIGEYTTVHVTSPIMAKPDGGD